MTDSPPKNFGQLAADYVRQQTSLARYFDRAHEALVDALEAQPEIADNVTEELGAIERRMENALRKGVPFDTRTIRGYLDTLLGNPDKHFHDGKLSRWLSEHGANLTPELSGTITHLTSEDSLHPFGALKATHEELYTLLSETSKRDPKKTIEAVNGLGEKTLALRFHHGRAEEAISRIEAMAEPKQLKTNLLDDLVKAARQEERAAAKEAQEAAKATAKEMKAGEKATKQAEKTANGKGGLFGGLFGKKNVAEAAEEAHAPKSKTMLALYTITGALVAGAAVFAGAMALRPRPQTLADGRMYGGGMGGESLEQQR